MFWSTNSLGLTKILLSTLSQLPPFHSPDIKYLQALSSDVLLSVKCGLLLLLALSFSSANKLSLILLSVIASSAINLASKSLLLSWVFFPLMSLAVFQSSYSCWHCAINIEYFSLEYFFNSIFPLKVAWVALLLCCLTGLFCPTEATFTIGVSALLLMYLVSKFTTASIFFSYLSGCSLTAANAVDNLSRLIMFSRYQTFDPGSRPWCHIPSVFPE